MKFKLLLILALLLPLLAACGSPATSNDADADAVARPAGWGEASHGSEAEPNYAVVFPQDKVNTLTITIAPEDWAAMQANMTELFGEPGARGFRPGDPNALPPGEAVIIEGEAPPMGGDVFIGGPPAEGGVLAGGPPGGPPGMRGGDLSVGNPMWVEATITFGDQTWENVGVRYKGNSSLMSGWNSETKKLPFKLDFDQFEEQHPEIADQRFYGFKQLSLSSNFGDATALRETVAYDLLEEAGLPAAETTFYEVVLDYGEGTQSLGLYTAVEVIDDTVVERVFGDDSGNIYEGDGQAASLAAGTEAQISASFQKENNEDTDWSDIEALYAALHSETRTADPAAWRAELERRFDVDGFLEWLAISAAIQHWDTYGAMSHNFYLYNDPATGKLTWISWDHNFVLGGSGGMVRAFRPPEGGLPGGALAPAPEAGLPGDVMAPAPPGAGQMQRPMRAFGGPGGSTALDKSDVDASWPLIRYLLDDPTYKARYLAFMEQSALAALDPDALAAKYAQLAELVRPYAAKEEGGEAAFDKALEELTTRTTEREQAVRDFLAKQ